MAEDRIEREVMIDAPVSRVWRLLTEAEHLGAWFGDAGADIDLRPGGAVELRWEEHGTAKAVIERIEPETLFSMRWALGDQRGAEPTESNSTLIEFTLAPDGEATKLRVVESGFESLDLPFEQRVREFERNEEGWGIVLGRLVEHAARATA